MTLKSLVDLIVGIIDTAVMPLLYSLAFIAIFIGIVRYFFIEGDEGREKGKTFLIWGIVGLVVIFSVWGVVRLLMGALNLGSA